MKRSRRIVVLCHCLLNASAIVEGEAAYPGVLEKLLVPLAREGTGIIQLPCPECSFLGLKRWGMTSEQYDTPTFRRHCASILETALDQTEDALANGVDILGIVGVKGSPSCGVLTTCFGFRGGVSGCGQAARRSEGEGIFIRTLREELGKRRLFLPMTEVENGNPETARWEMIRENLAKGRRP
ncbi:MAG: CD3072 family TudS-related putative desulfidase [Synergistales bacterium]